MFVFQSAKGGIPVTYLLMWFLVFASLFLLNEVSRRYKMIGLLFFFVMPALLSVLWFTVLKKSTYTDWFHLAKVYSATAGCIGFWLIRHYKKTRKDKTVFRLCDSRIALCFPPLILAVNIMEAVTRDIEVGMTYRTMAQDATADVSVLLMGGPWNFMNAAAGVLNIITITGWFGICLRKVTEKDKSKDMLWPDMLWCWIAAYDIWNFAYTYNCLPHHAWYCGLALLLAPTLCAFTVGKGAWLQHRAQTLALWCMFAQTFPGFQDVGQFRVDSSYKPGIYFAVSLIALLSNAAVAVYMGINIWKKHRSPYGPELNTDLKSYQEVKALAETKATI